MIWLLTLAAAVARADGLDVKGFGAKGDGATDDTAAFQMALKACAEAGGGVVSAPAGKYLIKGHLDIPGSVTLEGVWRAPATVDKYHAAPGKPELGPELKGTVLLAVEGKGSEDGVPFIMLNTNSTLKGVTIFYPEQVKSESPHPYPWTVASAGADNTSVIDVLMVNPYQAVDFGTRVAGRHYVRNLYAQAIRRGLYVDVCLDVGRLENIHFWPFWTAADPESPVAKFTMQHGEAFIFGRSDWEYVSNCFCISYKTGIKFIKSKANAEMGGGNYLLTQSGSDGCDVAVLVEETQGHSGVSFSNSQIFGDIVVKPSNNGMIRFSSCGIFGTSEGKNGIGAARIEGSGRVSFNDCHFYAIKRAFEAPTLIHALEGRVSVTNSVFLNFWDAPYNSSPIILEPKVVGAIITGNEFYSKAEIVNRSKGHTVVRDNIFETGSDPYPKGKPE